MQVLETRKFPDYMIKKVAGTYKYAGDIPVDGVLIGRVLRAGVPSARIVNLNVLDALKMPGVVAVVTSNDVPGLNAFGYFRPEQPVLCSDYVRYEGDALAAVAAETEEEAENALRSIRVELEPVEPVTSIDVSLSGKVLVHQNGNIPYSLSYEKGNYDSAQGTEISGEYFIEAVKPMYIELETTTAWVQDGNLHLITTTQSPEHDIKQISRSLRIPESKIQITYPDPGGAFGGKEEIHTQILASLLAMKSGRPVKLSLSREESNSSTTRRHAFKFYINTKVDNNMKITGLHMAAYADTGAYLSHGPGVIEVVGSHASGPYRIDNVKFEGYLVYTNYPPSGGMRGYGATEANFALERHLDKVIRLLNYDPIKFRKANAIIQGDEDGTGVVPVSTIRFMETLEKAEDSKLTKQSELPFIKVGIGVASGMKSTSYGQSGDSARVIVELSNDKVLIYFTTPDMGTGIRSTISKIAADSLGIDVSEVEVHNDSTNYPHSGTSNASRVTFMIGNAVINAVNSMKEFAEQEGRRAISGSELIGFLKSRGKIRFEGKYEFPIVKGGIYGKSDIVYSFATAIARVKVNILTGEVSVTDIELYPEAGRILNAVAFNSQMEGGIIMSMGLAVYEGLNFNNGRVIGNNFTTYMVPTARDIPRIKVDPIDGYEPLGPFGAKGAGELALVAVAPAIVNALVDATGKDLNRIPIRLEDLILIGTNH